MIPLTDSHYPAPGPLNALAYGWSRMKANALLLFLATLVAVIADMPVNQNTGDFSGDNPVTPLFALLVTAYALLLQPVFQFGVDLIFLRSTRGEDVKIGSILDGFQRYVDVVLAHLLVIGLIFIGIIALVIPGLYVACRLVFVSYLVMDEGMDPIAAVEGSWRMTRGHALKIFLLGLLSILLFLCGLALLLIGIFPAIMWCKSAFASLYLSIQAESTPNEPLLDETTDA
ncbi:MAG: hypothetical protein H7A06_10295 [Pseudomonadales bacterium]|nr:hypothetical protein [Pseudomonadales bacterium]